jgi:aminoglycoside phosphotransferase (APT) family kinase protein
MVPTPIDPADLSHQLGEDLFALVRAHLPPLVAGERISVLRSSTWARAAFRLRSPDGRMWKGRRFESSAAADRVARLHQRIPPALAPPLIAWRGAALLVDWAVGDVLASRRIGDDLIERAGGLLRAAHAAVVPAGTVDSPPRYPADGWVELLAARLHRIRQAGRLAAPDIDRALALARRYAPPPEPVSLCLGDLCPENLAVDADGRLSIIDTDGVDLHAPAFDLARARYRWPMTEAEWQVFGRGYGVADVLDRHRAHEPHWQVLILTGAADFRIGYGLPGSETALDRLAELLRRHPESTP